MNFILLRMKLIHHLEIFVNVNFIRSLIVGEYLSLHDKNLSNWHCSHILNSAVSLNLERGVYNEN